MRISQSLIKEYTDYQNGETCGLLLKAKYFDGVNTDGSLAQNLGNYFEWITLKSLPRDGKEPFADTTQKGEFTAPYKKIVEQAKNWDKIVKHYGIKIIEHGIKLQTDTEEGTLDMIAEMPGFGVFIGDTKTSGLMQNKWDERGWLPESLPYKDKLMIQAVHYIYLARKVLKKDLPFLFFVFSTGDDMDRAIFQVNVDEQKMIEHEHKIEFVRDSIIRDLEIGFRAIPSITQCATCPLKNKCKSFIDVPVITQIYY